MTERGADSVARDTHSFAVGPSSLRWDGTALIIDIDERAMPLPLPVRGRVRIEPQVMGTTAFALDDRSRHRWHPISPRARFEASFDAPDVRWSGNGYVDSNFGTESLEDGFSNWQWSRAHVGRDVGVVYEGERSDGSTFGMALRCDRTGRWTDEPMPPKQDLPKTPVFRIPRATRADADAPVRLLKTWEDTPFYSRSAIATKMFGEPGEGVHESLSLDRFVSPVVQRLLPFRMPRRA
jgi:carotenoid 1,2-hydratase